MFDPKGGSMRWGGGRTEKKRRWERFGPQASEWERRARAEAEGCLTAASCQKSVTRACIDVHAIWRRGRFSFSSLIRVPQCNYMELVDVRLDHEALS